MPVTINGTTGVSTPGAVLDNTTLLSAGTGTITFPAATGTVLLSGGSSAIPASGATGQIPVYTGATTIAGSFSPVIGVAGTNAGTLGLAGATSGTVTLAAPAVAGTNTATFPARTSNVMLDGPAFSAYLNAAAQSLGNTTSTKIVFDVEEYDTNSSYASGTFTASVSGYYQINAGAFIYSNPANSVTAAALMIYVNGSAYKSSGSNYNSSIQNITLSLASIVRLNVGDTVEIYGYGTPLTLALNGIARTYFNGSMLRGA